MQTPPVQVSSPRGRSTMTAVAVLLAVALACVSADKLRAPPTERPLRILCLMTIDTMSHHIWMSELTVELARRGHHVESVDVAVPKEVPPTLNVTVLETAFHKGLANLMNDWLNMNVLQQIAQIYKFGVAECEFDLSTPTMMRYVDKAYPGTFDVIIMDYIGDCFLGYAHRYNAPVILLSPFPGSSWMDGVMGNPPVPAVVPHAMVPYPQPMALWQRAATAGLLAYGRLLEAYYKPEQTAIVRKYFGQDTPSVDELRSAIHLAFINENPALDGSRPYSPSVIPVGGMHVKPANVSRIPADLRAWLDAAEEGFIFVSFGSIVRGHNLESDKKQALIESFGALGEKVRVLWKIEDGIFEKAKIPSNVRTSPWLPQNDLLGHPKMVLFVSHCGGLSTQEASYHGIPMLGVPFVVDQFVNLDKVVRIGMARRMPYKDITKQRLIAEIREMLANPKYREAARHTGELLRDQKESPLERAVWWTEYIGRHGGAPHLRSPLLTVPWPVAWLLDVVVLAVLAILAALVAVFLMVRTLGRGLGAALRPSKKHVKRD